MLMDYALLEHNITSDPDDYAARVQISGSADGDEIRAAHVSKRLDVRTTFVLGCPLPDPGAPGRF